MYVNHDECRMEILPMTMNAIKTTETTAAIAIVAGLTPAAVPGLTTDGSVVASDTVNFVVCFAFCDI